MRISVLSILPALASACVFSRPEFVEPRWGDAPPPLPAEVTEITWELGTGAGSCRYDQVVFRRDRLATHEFRTGRRLDSLFVARVDSASFAQLARVLVHRGFFAGREDEGAHEPLATRSLVMSVATQCRRRARQGDGDEYMSKMSAAVDSAAHTVAWTRCCFIE